MVEKYKDFKIEDRGLGFVAVLQRRFPSFYRETWVSRFKIAMCWEDAYEEAFLKTRIDVLDVLGRDTKLSRLALHALRTAKRSAPSNV